VLYNSLNRYNVYRFFPKDTKVIVKFDNYRDLSKIESSFWEKYNLEKIRNNPFMKFFPYKDFYLIIDSSSNIYLFSEFSFFAKYLDDYGKIYQNIFCYTSNKNFKLNKEKIYNKEHVNELLKIKDDISFYVNVKKSDYLPFIEDRAVYGKINPIPEYNLLNIDYKYDYDYKNVEVINKKIDRKTVPDRFDMYVNVNMRNFETHYADLRKLFRDSILFNKFFKFKNMIYQKSGIDIENDILELVENEVIIGVKNKNDYFAAINQVEEKELEQIEFKLSNKFPMRFETKKYKDHKYRSINLEGVAGFLASGVLKNKLEKIKKPYYTLKNQNLYFFDSYNFMKNYFDNINTYNLAKDERFLKYKNYSESIDENIEFYLNKRYLNEIIDDNRIIKYFEDYYGKIDFKKRSIQGSLVLKVRK